MSPEDEIQLPSSLLKLERLRAKHTRYFAQRRELSYRVNDLREAIARLEKHNEALAPEIGKFNRQPCAPGTHFPSDQIVINKRTIAAYRAMLAVAEEEAESCEGLADDARLFESLRRHMQQELMAWGVE